MFYVLILPAVFIFLMCGVAMIGDKEKAQAPNEITTIKVLRKKLDRLIIEKKYDFTDQEVVRLSQRLDKHIVKEQRKKAALQSNLR